MLHNVICIRLSRIKQPLCATIMTQRFNCFADWCRHKDDLSPEARHTVEKLLELADTSDCDEAERILSSSTSLYLDEYTINQISDITPLSCLTHLTYLSLHISRIRDITPLSSLTLLTVLSLHNNQISDITPLSGLTHLKKLLLGGNQISDITPLSSLTNLTILSLHNNQISDITPLFGLAELYILHLDNNPISNLNLLQTLQQQWYNLSTDPINYQQAIVAVESAYATIGFAEPEIIFCSSPYQGFASLSDCEPLGSSLAKVLSDAARKPPIWGLWQSLRELMAVQSEWGVHGQMEQQLRNDGMELEFYKEDGMELELYITPEEFVELISITEFCISEFGCVLEDKEQEVLRCLKLMLESCGWIFPFEKVCIVCDRPRILSFDNQQRLHAEGSPALQFADGWGVYAYHGVRLPEKYGKALPNQWQAQWLLEEQNAELRRVLIQGIGYARIVEELHAIELDSWQEYTLIKIDSRVDIEPIYLVKMTCPSTGYIHALRVPPDLQSAREAITWVNWGVEPEEFSVQT
jgi:internalin A